MKPALKLHILIESVKGLLGAEGIDEQDHDKAIKCLNRCANPGLCLDIYENYICY